MVTNLDVTGVTKNEYEGIVDEGSGTFGVAIENGEHGIEGFFEKLEKLINDNVFWVTFNTSIVVT
jgi:hypothetical protein